MLSRTIAPALMAAVCLGGCGTIGKQRHVTGAAVGAAVGGAAGYAVAGPVTAGIGAAGGAVVGGAIGGLVKGPIIKKRQYYRDTRGYCYWLDRNGKVYPDKSVKC
jgi:uncharacterized protein YcfJ